MKMTPELKAFKFYKKNINHYLEKMKPFWGDNERLVELYKEIADKFGADVEKLININYISYQRSLERAFK